MSEPIKINQLEIENVKRIKAVHITPGANGLTVIGGSITPGVSGEHPSLIEHLKQQKKAGVRLCLSITTRAVVLPVSAT